MAALFFISLPRVVIHAEVRDGLPYFVAIQKKQSVTPLRVLFINI